MEFVDLAAQHRALAPELERAIQKVIERSAFIGGEEVAAFEAAFAEAMTTRHAIGCANGTDALFLTLQAMEVQPGDEVIVPAHTWISTAETVTLAGGTPVFCDSEPGFFTMDPERVRDLITERTVGMIPVHLYGQPADMPVLAELAARYGLWMIEDCAQAHLATLGGQTVGSWGAAATVSFYPAKNLGAMGDAGAVLTSQDAVATFVRRFANHGGKGHHVMEGTNSRLDTLQAAVLSVKLPHLTTWTERRRALADRYDAGFEDVPGITSPPRRPDTTHVFHLYVIRAERRDALRAFLAERGIPTALHYPTMLPFLPAYADRGHERSEFPVVSLDEATMLSLPLYPEMPDADQDRVIDAIRSFAME